MSEKFCLKWNDFNSNVAKSFKLLRNEQEFFDVTLVSDDHKKVQAHRVVLSACSSYFKSILRGNDESSKILLCLDQINSQELSNVLDYIYNGEVQILQDDINRFLDIAQRFQLDGLLKSDEDTKPVEEVFFLPEENINKPEVKERNVGVNISSQESITIQPFGSITSIEELDSTIEKNFEKDIEGYFCCKICGKKDKKKFNIREHIETHIEGLSFPCNQCEHVSRSRQGIRKHLQRNNCN